MSVKGKRSRRSVPTRAAIAAEIFTVHPEEHEFYEQFCEEAVESLEPQGPVEYELARTIAVLQWRQKKIMAYETFLFPQGGLSDSATGQPEIGAAFGAARTLFDNLKVLNTLSMFDQRNNNLLFGALKRFDEVQAERRARHQAQIDKAVSMYRLFKANGKAFDPQCHGFVFSSSQIEMEAKKRELLERAQTNNPENLAV